MATEASRRLIKDCAFEAAADHLTLDWNATPGEQLWQRETGFLEMFLAYFYECGRFTSAAKSYRDFLFEVLSLHQKVASKSRNEGTKRDVKTKNLPQPEIIKKEAASPSFGETAALGHCSGRAAPAFTYEAPLDSLPAEEVYTSGDTVTEDEILASLKSQEDPNGNLELPMDAALEAAGVVPPDGSERLLPCLICLKWFAPDQRLGHQCVPSSVQAKSEEPVEPVEPLEPLERLSPSPEATAAADRQELLQRTGSRKRFKCRHCDKSFDSAYKLNRHGRIHSGERPFACGHCSKRFSRKEHRSRHLQQVHLEVQPAPYFPCDFCDRFFKTGQAKMFHERTHTARSEFEADDHVP